MAFGFMIDTDRPTYGVWKFGWIVDGSKPIQAWILPPPYVFVPVSADPQIPDPILFPLDFDIVRGGVGNVQLVEGGVAENSFKVEDNGTPDGAIRLLFDQTQLVDGESYRITLDVESVNAPTAQLILNWCDSPPVILQAPTTNPVVIDFPPPPLGYGLVRRFLEVRLPDFEIGDFTVANVQAQQI